MNHYYNPVRTIEGMGCVERLLELLSGMELDRDKVLLLTWDETVLELPVFARIQMCIRDS